MNVYQIITEKIIESLKKGEIPWRKPWKGGSESIPKNWIGNPYRGINVWLLGGDHNKPFWYGRKKIQELGGRIKNSEFLNHRLCVYYKVMSEKKNIDGSIEKYPKERFMLFYHKVWNIDQTEGMQIPETVQAMLNKEKTPEKIYDKKEECEKLIKKYNDRPTVTEIEQRAYYRPVDDVINMPKMGTFDSVDEYYSTLFHEYSHSTGHHKRLKRVGIIKGVFGDETYSFEELIAEFSATFLCGIAGIEQATIKNSTAYIQNWMKKLQESSQMVVQAAQAGSKAADYFQGIKPREYQNEPI